MRTNFLLNDFSHRLTQIIKWTRSVRSYSDHTRRTRLSGPRTLHLQTTDLCNARCIMCPYTSLNKGSRGNLMDDDLYRKIIDEAHATGETKTLCFMLQNEPLLDRRLPDRVKLARKVFGDSVRIMTVTNGAPMTAEMIEELIAAGISSVSVSIDAFHESTFNRIRQGLNHRHVIGNTLSLIKRMGPARVSVKFLRQRGNEGEENDFAAYWRQLGVRIQFIEPTNRAGTLESYERIKKRQPALWKKLAHPVLNRIIPACPLPFTSMNILWDGRVITCSEDWGPRDTVGDISKQPLMEIWNGEKINHYRHLLWNHRAAESMICAGCSLSQPFWRI
ncbi:MAG: SPASM domain-containing protein [Acidobacteria bacterium]|nr:SPASM domain-containing protein [Acidobacteriota bacterium]